MIGVPYEMHPRRERASGRHSLEVVSRRTKDHREAPPTDAELDNEEDGVNDEEEDDPLRLGQSHRAVAVAVVVCVEFCRDVLEKRREERKEEKRRQGRAEHELVKTTGQPAHLHPRPASSLAS